MISKEHEIVNTRKIDLILKKIVKETPFQHVSDLTENKLFNNIWIALSQAINLS